MNSPNRREPSEVRVVVEVDGKPVGFLNLDIDRLWPLVNHRRRDTVPAEWIDPERYETFLRAAVTKNLMSRLQTHLYNALGNEIVKAELDVESLTLRAEAAAQAFGVTDQDIQKLALEANRTPADFHAFFWEYLVDDTDATEVKKRWKAARKDEA